MADEKYVYNMAMEVMNYTSDKNKFSPNNIRRLIISPDAVMIELHVGYGLATDKTLKGLRGKQLDLRRLAIAQQSEKYEPAITIISKGRVARLIEEIVICGTSVKGNISLTLQELNVESLIYNYNNTSSNLKATISQRYKRLTSFIVYRGNLIDFYKNTSDYYTGKDRALRLLRESDWVQQNCQVEVFNENTWYKAVDGTASAYIPDRDGEYLNSHVKKVRDIVEEKIKNSAVDAYKKQKYGKQIEEMNKSIDSLRRALRMYGKFLNIQKRVGTLYNINFSQPPRLKLYNIGDVGKLPKNLVEIQKVSGNEGDCIKSNIAELKQCLSSLLKLYLELLKQAMGYYDRTVIDSLLKQANVGRPYDIQLLGMQDELFTGKASVKSSCINISYLLSILLLNDNDMQEKGRWEECWNK